MKSYVIKYQGYYLKEAHEGAYHTVLNVEDATDFDSLDSALYTLDEYFKLNVASVSIIEVNVITTETRLVPVGNEFLPIDQCEQCPKCDKWFRVEDMHPTLVDLETGIELYCETCHEDADEIVYNQEADLKVAYE